MQRSITRNSINDYKQYLLMAEKAKATVTKYINEAERLAEYLNGNPLNKCALLEYRETLAENFSSRTVNTKLAAINGYLSFIGADEYKVHLLKVQRKAFIAENRELSAAEYKRLVNAADVGGNDRLSLVMQTICATGIRISELSYITVDAVKERRMEIRLKGKSRTVIIPSKLCKKLVEYARRQRIDTGAVFRTKGGKPLDNLLELTPFVTLATEGTVTGWSNDTDEQVVVTFNNVGTLPQYVAAYYRLNKDSYAPDGTSLSFDGRETGEKGSWLGWSRYYYTQLNANDYEIPFTITDKNGFVKRGVIRFERDGKAGIEAEHGSVIYNDTEYTNGQTIDVAAGEITLQAKADEGYAFAGWEIAGKEYSDNPLTIEADGKFFIIKAKFAKLVTVSTGEGIVSEGAARFADDETAESKTVAAGGSVSITNVPGEKSKFVAWHVEYEKAEGKFMPAEEGRHYALGAGESLTDGTITIVAKEYNLRVYPEFEPTYSITLQQAEGGKASFAEPVSAIGKDAVSGLTKDSAAVTWEREVETGYRFDKWGIEYFDTAKNEWVADPTMTGSTVIYRFWTPVNGDGRMRPSMSAKVTEYDLRITPQFSKGLTVEAVADPAAGGTAEVTGGTDGYFYKNQNAKLKATATDGYAFGGWTIEYRQEDGTYAPAVAGTHYRAIIGSADTAEITAAVLDHSLRFTAKFTKQLYVELAQGEHGTAEFVGVTPDADNRVYGPDDSTGNIVATVKATPEEGYAFGGWIILNADTGEKAVGPMGGQYGNYFLEDGESEASNPLRIGFSKHSSANFHVNLKLMPVFGKEMKVTVASNNSEYGTVTPEGENIVSSVGGKLDFGAKPAEDCLFMGWEITYADGTEIPEKEKGNLFSFNTNSTDNDATGDNNQLTIFSCEKDLKLTAHFVKKGEPNFVRYRGRKRRRVL